MSTPFPFTNTPASSAPTPKLNLTTGALPRYISPTQPPTSKPPFAQIDASPFIATTTLLLPPELHTLLLPHLPPAQLTPHHARLHLTLSDPLTAPLLTHIQTPGTHISLLSTGTPGADDARYSLRDDGVLRLELARERYERAGLQGRAVASGGRKHVRERYVVEADLRSAGMREGKKGFERVRWAARELLGERRAWLGVVRGGAEKGVFEGLGAEWRGGEVEERVERGCRVPSGLLTGKERFGDEEDVWVLVEWADLVALASPRVKDGDVVDEFVSRYEVPGDADGGTTTGDVTVLRWTGLLTRQWMLDLLMGLVKASRVQKTGKDHWAVLSVAAHQTEAVGNVDGYHIFLQPGKDDVDGTEEPTGAGDIGSATVAINRTEDVGEHEQNGDEMDTEGPTARTPRLGFQRFTCMQFVDSVQL